MKEIKSVTKEITEILSKKGYPFAKVGFINYKLINPSTIKLEMEIKYGSKRNIDKVIVKGYENFPKNFIKNIFKPGKSNSLDVDKALELKKWFEKFEISDWWNKKVTELSQVN